MTDRYNKLSATTFQCSYNLTPAKIDSVIVSSLYSQAFISQPLLVAYFESYSEHDFKDFMLHPHKRLSKLRRLHHGALYVVKSGGIAKIGRLAMHEGFVVIFFRVDPNTGIKSAFDPLAKNNLL